ncbi:MAG: TetR/AcrR family transcriptional regulator [Ktedonobacteraceae bacterium]|nr:TetR/AcrR family transcriptional regulator [Ktedonobacteraceae bacterium]MBV9711140.1 TetR/AcrR family transcriptional regulator [Ktedonobacteraceae bacterium]
MSSTARERRHARTRQAILDAAEQIIADRGVEGLSMREIAHHIEYSASGLYEYFGGKDEIIQALCMEGFERLTSRIRQKVGEHLPAQRLVESALAYVEFAMEYPDQYLLMFSSTPKVHISLEQLDQNSAYGLLKQIIRDGIESDTFKVREDYGLEEITYNCWTLVHGIAMLRLTLFKHQEQDFDAFNRNIVEQAVKNLCTT